MFIVDDDDDDDDVGDGGDGDDDDIVGINSRTHICSTPFDVDDRFLFNVLLLLLLLTFILNDFIDDASISHWIILL